MAELNELSELMEAQQEEQHQAAIQARAALDRTKELKDKIQRMIDDPSFDASPWLATKSFMDAVKTAVDPNVDDRRRRQAEIVVQQRVALHTAWKSRQLTQVIAARADATAEATARMVSRATWGIAVATGALVLATIGLIIVTIMQHH